MTPKGLLRLKDATSTLQELADERLGEEVVAVVALRPGVVLLDVMLPDLDGFAVADRLAALAEPPAVVLTSSRDPRDYGERLSRSGACGFIRKDDLTGAALERIVAAG